MGVCIEMKVSHNVHTTFNRQSCNDGKVWKECGSWDEVKMVVGGKMEERNDDSWVGWSIICSPLAPFSPSLSLYGVGNGVMIHGS